VTYYLGPWQYLRCRRRILADVRGVVGPSDAVILRVCSQVAACLEPQLRRGGRPYGVEVVGDPYDVFAPGAVVHPLRPFFCGAYAPLFPGFSGVFMENIIYVYDVT